MLAFKNKLLQFSEMIINFKEAKLAEGNIDRENSMIKGVSLISTPEAKGHNLSIDEASIDSFLSAVDGKQIKAYYTHSPENDALDSIGLWSNFRKEQDEQYTKLLGDFTALKAWRDNNPKDFEMLFELAEKAPEAFGVSAEFQAELIYYEDGEAKQFDKDSESDVEVFARAKEVSAFSIVASPASNPTGLFAEAKQDEMQKQFAETIEAKESLALELKTTQENFEILAKKHSELEEENKKLSEKLESKKEEAEKWQIKYAKFIDEMGSDPVDAPTEIEQKTFEEQLQACSSWAEKNQLIKQNMGKLMQTWNPNN